MQMQLRLQLALQGFRLASSLQSIFFSKSFIYNLLAFIRSLSRFFLITLSDNRKGDFTAFEFS